MAEQLTAQQQLAVSDRGGKLLVSAAAGSGKTKVLVDRLLSYLTDPSEPANIDEFLIITYTKAAASELRGKIAEKLSRCIAQNPQNRHMQRQMERLYLTKISTVHSFCGDILREYAYRLDIPGDFRIAEENECRQLQNQVLEHILEEAYSDRKGNTDFQSFVDTQGLSRNDMILAEIILQVYNSARCHMDPDKWLEQCILDAEASGVEDASETVWGKYIINSLHKMIHLHISAMNEVVVLAQSAVGMEKAVALLIDTVQKLSEIEACSSWDEITAHRELDFGRISFSTKADPILKEHVKAVRDACKKGVEKALRPFSDSSEQILQDLKECASASRGLVALVRIFSAYYEKEKKNKRILDFGDLEHKMLDLLLGKSRSGPTGAATEIAKRFREIMVDEYQDSNQVQDAIFSILTMDRNNCFMVGDVKQSIYQFRLADPQIFLDKYNCYDDAPGAALNRPRRILLSHNFRSSGPVIEAVNHVFGCCMSPDVGGLSYGEDEMLREGIPHLLENEPEVELHAIDVQQNSYAEEAAYTAKRIGELLDGSHTIREGDHFRPIRPEDIVILLRSPGSVGLDFCRALEYVGIPCTMGGGEDLLETEEVGLLYALLQVIDNPLQDIPLITVLSSRLFVFTADELAALRSLARKGSFYEALKCSERQKVRDFLALLTDLRHRSRICSVSQLMEYIFSKTAMDSIFGAMNDTGERVSNLQAFCQLASGYEQMSGKDLGQFIEYIRLLSEKKLVQSTQTSTAGVVTIMSIHKSKGLEFPVVFLCGLARSFNQESLRQQVLCHKDLGLGLTCVDRQQRVRYPSIAKRAISAKLQEESVSEELRVLYVAMTRAKDRLIMTYAPKNLSAALCSFSLRMDVSPSSLMNGEASCPGDWVIYAALQRTDAGELFTISHKPERSAVHPYPWLIRVEHSLEKDSGGACPSHKIERGLPGPVIQEIKAGLSFSYRHMNSTVTPSKQTATQLKGRVKDQEASEHSPVYSLPKSAFRKPSFESSDVSGTGYGNLLHSIMQYIHFDHCTSLEDVETELSRLAAHGVITKEQQSQIDPMMLFSFFDSSLGMRFVNASHLLKEFKFSILMDAEHFADGVKGEEILVQGVVDCALIEEDGIVIVDFKTDRVDEFSFEEVAQRYRQQVEIYAEALARIFEKEVKETYLYFFRINKFVKI